MAQWNYTLKWGKQLRDDELNGIHCGWALDFVDANDTDEDNMYLIEMINETYGNIKLDGKAVLIS